MRTLKVKSKTITTLALLMTIASTLLTYLPAVKAADVQPRAFLAVVPNPVGVNQQVYVTLMLEPIPPLATDIFHGFELTITPPTGPVETRGPMNSSPIGSQFLVYIPTQVGTYEFQFSYPGETFSWAGGTNFLPATSPVTELVVQQNPIEPYPEVPFPTDYWTRPINAQHRNWYTKSGNWLMRAYNSTGRSFGEVTGYNPYSQAPLAPHVMWTKELTLGGLAGGDYSAYSYYGGQAYETKLAPPIIMNGRLYYKIYQSGFSGSPGSIGTGFVAVDLRTGEELWRNTEGIISHGQLFNFVSPNQMGPIAYLWDIWPYVSIYVPPPGPGGFILPGEYHVYDAFNGDLFMTFTNALGGVVYYDCDGSILVYTLNGEKGWLSMWNSTKAFEANGFLQAQESGLIQFRPVAGTYDWATGIQWNATIPIRHAVVPYETFGGYMSTTFATTDQGPPNGVLVAAAGGITNFPLQSAYNLTTGEEIWFFDRNAEPGGESRMHTVFQAAGEGMYAQFDAVSMRWLGYNITTGVRKWVSDPMDYPFGQYIANSNGGIFVYGKLYTADQQGTMHAFDAETGEEVWRFNSGNSGLETPYGSWPMGSGPIIADGVVYTGIGEHSPTNPLMRGGKLFALNAEDGTKIWEMNGWISVTAIADGYLVGYNLYDNRIYVIGKGPSATTVSVSPEIVTNGTSVMIKGMVTDQSSGQKGTGAVSDADMGEWMAYVHQQQQAPMDAVGVPVMLQALGPDGIIDIGTVTSDGYGMFKKMWTPPDEGEYTIMAAFAGTNSYGSSYAESAMGVSPAPSEPEPVTIPDYTPMFAGIIAAVAIAIVIGVGNLYLLRKHK